MAHVHHPPGPPMTLANMRELGEKGNMITSHSDLLEHVQALTWVHAIDLGNGIVTPAMWGPPSPTIMRALDTIDFRGKKVLDIGCWDGLWSFEAEKRGATTVVATDLNTQRWPPDGHLTFMLAHEALGSKAIYRPDVSVYDVPRIFPERDFDVVLFCGIYYHLRDPLLALSRLRQAMNPGGVLVVEGEVALDREKCGAEFFYKNLHSNDPSNWWVPTIRCLHEWVESSYFDVLQEFLPPQPQGGMTLAERPRRERVPPELPMHALDLHPARPEASVSCSRAALVAFPTSSSSRSAVRRARSRRSPRLLDRPRPGGRAQHGQSASTKTKDAMRPLSDEELSRVQDLYRLLPPWKRGEFLQELASRMQGRKLGHADLRREAVTAMRAVLGRGHPWVPEAD